MPLYMQLTLLYFLLISNIQTFICVDRKLNTLTQPCPLVFPGAELPFTWPASPNEGSVVPADSRPTGD